MGRLLIVEDDPTIGRTLDSWMRGSGHEVTWCANAEGALRAAEQAGADLVLLDLGLPDMDGFAACRELRSSLPSAVIVVLTARRDQLDILSALEVGADDYLFKPFSLVELAARVRAHLRRRDAERLAPARTTIGSLTIDAGSRRALVGSREVPLRPREFDLLVRLARTPGAAISRETLMADVWDADGEAATKTLDVHMVSLRRKLADAAAAEGGSTPATLPRIVTLRGHGFRLDEVS